MGKKSTSEQWGWGDCQPFRTSCEKECVFQSVMERHCSVLGIEKVSFDLVKPTESKQKPLSIHNGGLIKGTKRSNKRNYLETIAEIYVKKLVDWTKKIDINQWIFLVVFQKKKRVIWSASQSQLVCSVGRSLCKDKFTRHSYLEVISIATIRLISLYLICIKQVIFWLIF